MGVGQVQMNPKGEEEEKRGARMSRVGSKRPRINIDWRSRLQTIPLITQSAVP